MKIITVSSLKVGQRFKWIPNQWFGAGKLISKKRRTFVDYHPTALGKRHVVYDLKYDAKVVNPPAIDYGVSGSTKVKLLRKGER